MDHDPLAHVDESYPNSETTSRIIAAAHEVHHHLGPGFREIFYQRALVLELPAQELEFSREVKIPIYYRETQIGHSRVYFVIEEILVEVKAKSTIEGMDVIQTLSYLKASEFRLALLLNFGTKRLGIKRLVHTPTG